MVLAYCMNTPEGLVSNQLQEMGISIFNAFLCVRAEHMTHLSVFKQHTAEQFIVFGASGFSAPTFVAHTSFHSLHEKMTDLSDTCWIFSLTSDRHMDGQSVCHFD